MSILESEIQNIKGLAMSKNKKRVGGLGRMRILMPRPAVADSTALLYGSVGSPPGWATVSSSPTRLEDIYVQLDAQLDALLDARTNA